MKIRLEIVGKILAAILLLLGCFVLAVYTANLMSDFPMDVHGDLMRNLPWALPLAIAGGLMIAVFDNRNKPR